MADPAGGRTLPLTFPKHFPDKGDIIKDIWSSKWQKSGVKIRRVQGWTVHRCPTLCPPFWPPLVLKLNCIFSRFCLFSWKMLLLSKKVPFCTENMQLDIRKVLFFCKKVPLCLEKVPFCSKKCPFAWKKSPFARKKCPFTWKKCPFAWKNSLFWLVHRWPNFLFSPLAKVFSRLRRSYNP